MWNCEAYRVTWKSAFGTREFGLRSKSGALNLNGLATVTVKAYSTSKTAGKGAID